MNPEKKTARIAGFLYLIVAITGFFSTFAGKKLIVPENTAVTAGNILSSAWLFNANILSIILMSVSWLLLAYFLFLLFEKVNKNTALLMLLFVSIGCALTCISGACLSGSRGILSNPGYAAVYQPDQVQSLAMLLVDISKKIMNMAYLFFGLWLLPLGYLIIQSGLIPKILGIFIILSGTGYLADLVLFFLFPGFHGSVTNFTFFGEVMLLLWLLIKGVQSPQKISKSAE